MEAQLELFGSADEYDLSSAEQLRRDQESVLLAFAGPKLQVKDRWIALEAKGEGMEAGSAFVVFSAIWMGEIPGYADPEAPYYPDGPGDPDRPGANAGGKIPRMEQFVINEEEI